MKLGTFFLLLIMAFPVSIFAQQMGKASYYSNRLIGRKMTNGERYNAHEFVAAHRTYPFGTVLKVTNLGNGKFVVVRVTDRGPYSRSRVIDVSYAAAKRIGLTATGHANVKVEVANDLRFLVSPEPLLSLQLPKLNISYNNPISID